MFKAFDFFDFLEGQANVDEITHLILIVECINWSLVLIANSRCLERWHSLFSPSPVLPKKAGGLVNYKFHIGNRFEMYIYSAREMKLSSRQSTLRLASAISAYSSNKVQEVHVVLTSNSFARASTRQSWIVAEYSTDNVGKAPRVLCVPATKLSFLRLLPSKLYTLVADTLWKVEAKEHEVEELST